MQKLIAIMFGIFLFGNVSAQQIDLTLDEAIELARQKSFEAFKAKNMYLDKALDYQTYLKILHPKATLSVSPSNYSSGLSQQFNSNTGLYGYYNEETLTTDSELELNKHIGLTGGDIYLSSYLYRQKTFLEVGSDTLKHYSKPMYLTYSQNFAKVNNYKWRAKIDPISFDIAKKQYLEDVESITLKTLSLYFKLLISEMNLKIAELNKNNADTLFLFGEKKFEIGAITRDNYLKLQLKKVNAGIVLESRLLDQEDARLSFNNFLELPRETKMKCITPNNIPSFEVESSTAISKVFINNPSILYLKQKIMVAGKAVDEAKANRYSANFSATIGFNKAGNKLNDIYQDLDNLQRINLKLSVPIIDWGDTKRAIAQAKLNKDLVEESARKEKDAIELEILVMVNKFNIKHKQVLAAAQADSISQIAYEAVKQQFMLGKASVLDINTSYTDMQSAQNSYLNSLNNFWTQLYSIRKLCLYDFEKQIDLDADFDKMLNEYH